MHRSTLRDVGGSLTVTLPRQMLRTLGLAAGAAVSITVEGGRLVLSPVRPHYTLAELLEGLAPGDLPTDAQWEDTAPSGHEAW